MTGYAPVETERLDPACGERQPPGRGAVLAVQDAGDGGVGVVLRQAADQVDSALIGAGDIGQPRLYGD